MPVGFLSEDQVAGHGRFAAAPGQADLARFFVLDGVDRALIGDRRRAVNRLGFAVQLATVRYLGAFVPIATVPEVVVVFVGGQLDIDADEFAGYGSRVKTVLEHQWEIRSALGLVDFADAEGKLGEFLAARAWTRRERPSELFDHAVVWLRNARVLLPGASVLERLVSEVRSRADSRMYTLVADGVSSELAARLDGLLEVGDGRISVLERLRRSPTIASGRQLALALERVLEVREIGAHRIDLTEIPEARVDAMARYGLALNAAMVRRLPSGRRVATVVAVVRALLVTAIDDALDVFSVLMTEKLIRPAERRTDRERLRGWDDLAAATTTMAPTVRLLLELINDTNDETDPLDPALAWERLVTTVQTDRLEAAVRVTGEVAPATARDHRLSARFELLSRYRTVAQFLKLFHSTIPFTATPPARPILDALAQLAMIADGNGPSRARVVEEVIGSDWRPLVFDSDIGGDGFDEHAYVLCVLEALHVALRRRDVHVAGSRKWGDPRAQLIDGVIWERSRKTVLTALRLTEKPQRHLDDLAERIAAGYLHLAARLDDGDGPPAWVDATDGRTRLHLNQLEAIPEPASLIELAHKIQAMLPRVDLPDLLMDIHALTGCFDEFTHHGLADHDHGTRLDDLPVSLAAVFIAEGCNLGYTPVIKGGHPALTRTRLSHINQNYVRADTLAAANARLIDTQATIATAQVWGGGHVASIDGLRFVVPVRTLDAGPNPRYFGHRRGITWLNAINDQIAGIGAVVVTGTMRDSLHVLDVILRRDGGVNPEIVTTDTAGYSDIVFGLFRLLGYQFSPRLRDLPDQRLWRFTHQPLNLADGPLAQLPVHRLNHKRIIDQWPDMLRVTASLHTGLVNSHDLIRMLARDGNPTPLGAAIADYGRAAKTLHILSMTEPDDTRRRIVSQQLSSQEGRHRLGRKVFHGQRGELRQRYRTGQEDQLGVLGLVLNAIVLWNTLYIDLAIDQLQADGHTVDNDDIARLSPLIDEHLNVHGRYTITPTDPDQPLRSLRDPTHDDNPDEDR